MSRVRLYGHRLGGGSFQQITEGMRRALEAAGLLAGVVYSDAPDEDNDDGYDAPVALVLGGAVGGLMAARRFGMHAEHWVMLAPNSERLPPNLAERLVEPSAILPSGLLDGGILTPSHWGKSVLTQYFPDKQIVVCPHGVSEAFRMNPAQREAVRKAYDEGRFNVLHMSSAEYERKGTVELLEAWKMLLDEKRLPDRAMLYVTMSLSEVGALEWKLEELQLGGRVEFLPAFALDEVQVAAMYSNAHLVCQPSRAEGFGLTPLEARCCGVPVLMTMCTGHADHAQHDVPESCIVQGTTAPMYDFPGSRAPLVLPEWIATSIASVYPRWKELDRMTAEAAGTLAEKYRWERVASDGIQALVAKEPTA